MWKRKSFATSDMSKQYTITEILSAEIEALRTIPQDNDYEAAIRLILNHVHQGGGRLITSGMGKAGQIAHNIATTFSSTGTPAYFLHPSEAQHGDLGMVCEGDVMLLISNSGKTREVLELVALTRRMYPHLPFILITGNSESPLSQLVDVTMPSGADTDDKHDCDDGAWRPFGSERDAAHRLHLPRLLATPPWWLPRRQEP